MNTSLFRASSLAVALAIGLSACGGSSDGIHVNLGGTVSGLTTSGLVLSNSGVTLAIDANATSFMFAEQVTSGQYYGVAIRSQPTDATCAVTNGSGTVSNTDITNVQVACTMNGRLGGTISNLVGSGLVLANGNSTVAVEAGSTSFVFAERVVQGAAYGVTILSQPAGQVCTVANGAAKMPATDVSTVQVSCQ